MVPFRSVMKMERSSSYQNFLNSSPAGIWRKSLDTAPRPLRFFPILFLRLSARAIGYHGTISLAMPISGKNTNRFTISMELEKKL